MLKNFARVARLFVLSLAAALMLSGCQKEPADGPLKTGGAAPDFEAELLSGDTVKLSDYRDKVVLLNFWATWCPPCVGEMPDLQRLSEDYPDDLAVLGIDVNEDADVVKSFVDEKGYTYDIGFVSNDVLTEKYPTDGIPYTLIIDKNGVISAIHVGARPDMYSVYEKDLKAALGE